ncbi:hypothetical protein [Chitinimonas lacunae]|uniref:Uncharacterized protein n=1 Tax=Chitinimonas lacunae TaxID=1963018 RepID=A0ABV8MMP3_9NEIS
MGCHTKVDEQKQHHADPNGVQRHHWLFERNQGIGKRVPDVVKNQPWNINPIRSDFNNWLGRKPWKEAISMKSETKQAVTLAATVSPVQKVGTLSPTISHRTH